MTKEKQDIKEDFYSGDTKDIVFEIVDKAGALYPLSNASADYALFTDEGVVLIRKSSDQATEIEFDVPNSLVTVHLLPPDTLHIYGTFRHQLLVIDQNAYAEITSTGKVNIKRSFARRFESDSQAAFLQGG